MHDNQNQSSENQSPQKQPDPLVNPPDELPAGTPPEKPVRQPQETPHRQPDEYPVEEPSELPVNEPVEVPPMDSPDELIDRQE